jgi:hypothetical protein
VLSAFEVAATADIEPLVAAMEPKAQVQVAAPPATKEDNMPVVPDDDPPEAASNRLRVQRVAAPSWIGEPRSIKEEQRLFSSVGEQPEWGFAIPWVYRALASPLTGEPMPAAPRRGDPHPGTLGYWAALLHMLFFSLGWARPDRGLRWWYDAGRPTDDDRLRLLHSIWDTDGQLDWFAAWLWSDHVIETGGFAEATGYQDDGREVDVDRAWIERQRDTAEAAGAFVSPFGAHLAVHWSAPLDEPRGDVFLLRSGKTDRHAVLMADSMIGWYRALALRGADLPNIPGRSWHVDVVVRPVGWLGTYRRSRVSGLWFAGPHRFHIQGI